MLKEYQIRILELLQQFETEVSHLYEIFAKKFPDQSDMWNKMVQEEINHADYVKKLFSLAQEGKLNFDEKMTKTYTLKIVIDDIKAQQKKAAENQFTLLRALSISHNLEESIIEKKLYDSFTSDDRDIKLLLEKIKTETREHASQIKKFWEEKKQS